MKTAICLAAALCALATSASPARILPSPLSSLLATPSSTGIVTGTPTRTSTGMEERDFDICPTTSYRTPDATATSTIDCQGRELLLTGVPLALLPIPCRPTTIWADMETVSECAASPSVTATVTGTVGAAPTLRQTLTSPAKPAPTAKTLEQNLPRCTSTVTVEKNGLHCHMTEYKSATTTSVDCKGCALATRTHTPGLLELPHNACLPFITTTTLDVETHTRCAASPSMTATADVMASSWSA
ncbi:hypothetical protein LTR36_001223 [Oleoguttula mirabilis]|uniref:Uncharacterized protein n=1 Tax=Oleoguttula mirabilis TaxID=1507867 RepID=A0AAV9JN63_9PEZI|nr:hypothetical protein LTR36_001223 [Oleoguttula mirabilis]